MKHTDFGEWRVTHEDLRIHHATQPCRIDLAECTDPAQLVTVVTDIGGEEWATSKTMEDLLEALDFALELWMKHARQTGSVDLEKIRKVLKSG